MTPPEQSSKDNSPQNDSIRGNELLRRTRLERLTGSEVMMVSSGEEYKGPTLEGTIGGLIDEIRWDFSVASYEGIVHIKIVHLNSNKRFISNQRSGVTRFFEGEIVDSKFICSFRAQSRLIKPLKIPLHTIEILSKT